MQYLSLHIIFSIKVDIRQYQECIQNGQNMNFDFFAPEFGALPILQDCPNCQIYFSTEFQMYNLTCTVFTTFIVRVLSAPTPHNQPLYAAC